MHKKILLIFEKMYTEKLRNWTKFPLPIHNAHDGNMVRYALHRLSQLVRVIIWNYGVQ